MTIVLWRLRFKSSKSGNKIWLGLTEKTESLRPYSSLASIWNLVARTAFTQLNYSLILLLLTVVAMGIIYFIPPVGVILGIFWGNGWLTGMSIGAWLLMIISFHFFSADIKALSAIAIVGDWTTGDRGSLHFNDH